MTNITNEQARALRKLPETGPLRDLNILAFGVLHDLVTLGLASSNVSGPHVTFNITTAGRKALEQWEKGNGART